MRKFDTGAVRDSDENKLDFEGFLSPLVLMSFANYMHKNRYLKDGTIRDSDNWQQGFGTPEEHYASCIESMLRHMVDLWLNYRGFEKLSRSDTEEALCAILFNSQAYLHQLKKTDYENM